MIKKNIHIYFDTEFSDLYKNINDIQLISIGFHSTNNDSLYLELPFDHYNVSDFVLYNVIPYLNPIESLTSYDESKNKIIQYLSNYKDNNITLFTDAPQYDCEFLFRIINKSDFIKHDLLVDFKKIQFLSEAEDEIFTKYSEEYFNNNEGIVHHALDDAKCNAFSYEKVLKYRNLNSNNPLLVNKHNKYNFL